MIKMNKWAWVGIGGGIIGMLIGIFSVLSVHDSMGILFTLAMIVIFASVFILMWRLFIGPMMNAARLQKTGIPGKATVLEVKDTGVTINNNPQVKLLLEIRNSFGQKYTASCRTLVSRINPFAFQPGMEVQVKIDPKNEQNVVIDYNAGQPAVTTAANSLNYTQADSLNLKAELEKMQQENDTIRSTGRAARAIIKKYTWLGSYVNGNNPYVELELEVLPESSPSFSGKTRGVIAEASVEKYQPGKEIFVKYDLYDNAKVTIDHS